MRALIREPAVFCAAQRVRPLCACSAIPGPEHQGSTHEWKRLFTDRGAEGTPRVDLAQSGMSLVGWFLTIASQQSRVEAGRILAGNLNGCYQHQLVLSGSAENDTKKRPDC